VHSVFSEKGSRCHARSAFSLQRHCMPSQLQVELNHLRRRESRFVVEGTAMAQPKNNACLRRESRYINGVGQSNTAVILLSIDDKLSSRELRSDARSHRAGGFILAGFPLCGCTNRSDPSDPIHSRVISAAQARKSSGAPPPKTVATNPQAADGGGVRRRFGPSGLNSCSVPREFAREPSCTPGDTRGPSFLRLAERSPRSLRMNSSSPSSSCSLPLLN